MTTKVQIAKRAYVTATGDDSPYARPDAERLEFRWADGRTPLRVSIHDYPEHIRDTLAWHALSQKIGDSYANSGGDIDWAEEQAVAVHQMMVAGDWTRKREADSLGRATDLAKAIAEVTGYNLDAVKAALSRKDKDERKTFAEHPAVAAVIARIREERARAKRTELESAADAAGDLDI